MDLSSTFRAEVYRPVVTVVIPGATAIAPFVGILLVTYPTLLELAVSSGLTAAVLILLAAITAGLVIEDLGSLVESEVLERLYGDKEELISEWYEYLRLCYTVEPIGQRYLRATTLRLKFELSFGISLVAFVVGTVWLNCLRPFMEAGNAVLLTIFFLVLAGYLLWESYNSSRLLKRLRAELLKGIHEK